MSASINKVILIGRLGKDPELKYTANGTPVAKFSLATDDVYKDKMTGEQQQRTEWHNIVAWSKLADLSKRYLTKGRQVYIEGRLRTREWDDKDGNKRRTTEIVASQMVLLGSRSESGESAAPMQRGAAEAESGVPASPGDVEITDDDIPF